MRGSVTLATALPVPILVPGSPPNTINDETLRIIEEELDEREMLSSTSPLGG